MSQSLEATYRDTQTIQDISCSRWVMGALGTIMAISAIAFAILGLIQPEWFTQAMGMVGDLHSWALWTISGGAFSLGCGLIGFAILTGKTENQVRSNPSNQGTHGNALEKSFQSKKNLKELFAEDANFLDEIQDYPKKLPGNAVFEKQLMRKSVMKGVFENDREWRFGGLEFIVLKVKCISPVEILKKEALSRMQQAEMTLDGIADAASMTPTQRETYKENFVKEIEEEIPAKPALLLFFRPTLDGWQQLHVRYDDEKTPSLLTPSFIGRFEGGDIACTPNPVWVNEPYIRLQEEGFLKLKKLMKGEQITDHRGHTWQLDDSK